MSKTYYARFGTGDCRNFSGLTPTFLIFSQNGSGVTPPAISEIVASSGIYSFTYGTTTPIAFLLDGFTTGLTGANRYLTGSIDPADRADEYGNTLIAYGLTAIALGTTTVALGTTTVALGVTSVAWGLTNNTALTNVGTTLVAIGNTAIALGTTNVALGTTNVALGTTAVSWGSVNNTSATNNGTTLVAIGNTTIALGTTNVALGLTILSYVIAGSGGGGAGISQILGVLGSTASAYLPPVDLFGYMKRIQQDLEGNQTFTKTSGVLQFFDSTGATQLFSKTITNSASLVLRS